MHLENLAANGLQILTDAAAVAQRIARSSSPACVDVMVLSWQKTHADGRPFAAVAAERAKPAVAATETV